MARNFKGDDIFAAWSKLREVIQLAEGQAVHPPIRHRTVIKLAEELVKDVSETEKNGTISLLVPSSELGLVRGRLDCNVGDERPVATRLESLEDMVKGVVDRLARMETNQARGVSAPQPLAPQVLVQQPMAPPVSVPLNGNGSLQQQNYAGITSAGLTFDPRQVNQQVKQFFSRQQQRQRRDSSSAKRSVSGAVRDMYGNDVNSSEEVFTDVVNKKKKRKELSKGTATLQAIPGVNVPLQAAYQHFVGNTPGNMEKETMELVFKELAAPIMLEKGLEGPLLIEQCNLMTKEQNTRTRVWRVVVPNKYKEIMQDDRIYPTGWHHREFEGNFRPPLSPEERAEKDAKKLARQQNDSRVSALLRNLAGSPLQSS